MLPENGMAYKISRRLRYFRACNLIGAIGAAGKGWQGVRLVFAAAAAAALLFLLLSLVIWAPLLGPSTGM